MQSWGQWAEQVPQPIQVFMKELLLFLIQRVTAATQKCGQECFFSVIFILPVFSGHTSTHNFVPWLPSGNYKLHGEWRRAVTNVCYRSAIENRFAMGWVPTGTMFSHGLRSKCADLAEL